MPAWHPGLTMSDAIDIEWVQRAALNIILGMSYTSYKSALEHFNLETLESIRVNLWDEF